MLQLHPMPHHHRKASVRARRKQVTPQDEQGQRLDAARAAFRAAWQAKVDRKRQQAVRIRGLAEPIRYSISGETPLLLIAAGCIGAFLQISFQFVREGGGYSPLWLVLGFGIVTIPLRLGALFAVRLCDRWAERCEQSADLMELPRHRNSK